MIIRAVFFDLDGTLVDSQEDLTNAVNHVRSAFSLSPLTVDAVRLKVGKGARNLIRQVLPDVSDFDFERALASFLDFNRRHIADKTRLYPGMQEVLTELAAGNIRMAVITNKNEDLSALLLKALGIYDLFERISGGDTYPEKKPLPLPLLKVAEKMEVGPHECVMAGDSINDIQAGQRADMATIACRWGYGSAEELSGADAFANTPQELLAVITSGFGTRL
jgi:phosphoglycolate phosphatase